MLLANHVRKSLVDIANSVSGRKRVTDKGNASFSGWTFLGVVLVVPVVGTVVLVIFQDPAIGGIGQGEGIGFVVDKAIIDFSRCHDQRQEQQQDQDVALQ